MVFVIEQLEENTKKRESVKEGQLKEGVGRGSSWKGWWPDMRSLEDT